MKLSLVSCSSAELTSVSFHPCKIQTQKLYLQLVKKSNHLPDQQTASTRPFRLPQADRYAPGRSFLAWPSPPGTAALNVMNFIRLYFCYMLIKMPLHDEFGLIHPSSLSALFNINTLHRFLILHH